MSDTDGRDPLRGRAAAIRDAARRLLERDGPEGLAMRPLAEAVGLHPPAVYRHFADKRAVERAVAAAAGSELGDVLLAALRRGAAEPLDATCRAYRAWAVEHPHLYRLLFARPVDPLADGPAERQAPEVLRDAAGGDETAGRALWACSHGLVSLELDGRLHPGEELDAVWRLTVHALQRELE